MKKSFRLITLLTVVFFITQHFIATSQTVTDVDGNIYSTIEIGSQTWLKENMKTLHYPDSTPIVSVLAYNNDDSLANIYGRLYNWNATMNNSHTEKAQGICPDGWHVPSISEWDIISQYLGGDNVAGGKMKEEGIEHWFAPNTGANNESGFTALPGGEKDNNVFWLMGTAAVIWSSSETSSDFAEYRYLLHDDAKLGYYNYYKSFHYSVRCVKDATVGQQEQGTIKNIKINPNPACESISVQFTEQIKTPIKVEVFSASGKLVKDITIKTNKIDIDITDLAGGLYIFTANICDRIVSEKFVKDN